jgi:hypothetical protein
MDENNRLWMLFWGSTIASTTYLIGCFVAGLALHNPLAWRLALASLGYVYLCNMAQAIAPRLRILTISLLVLSVAAGCAAGVDLLLGG